MSDPTSNPQGTTPFATRLTRLAARGQAHIQGVRQRAALGQALNRLLPALLVVPGLVFCVQLMQTLVGEPRAIVNGWIVLGLTALFAFGFMAVEHLRHHPTAVSPQMGLAAFDLAGDAADRLTTADAFLQAPARTAFMQAAVEDAEAWIAPAEAAALSRPPFGPATQGDALRYVGAALLLCLFVGLAGQAGASGAFLLSGPDRLVADTGDVDTTDTKAPVSNPREDEPKTVRAPEPESAAAGTSESKPMKRAPADLKEDAKKTEGRSGAGQASDAESMSGANDARGAPSNQSPASKKGTPKKPKPTKKPIKKKAGTPPTKTPKTTDDQQSGSTAGRGSSKGSNKNPIGSGWKSKDQVDPEEEDDSLDDDEVEDEESDQEARGGVQPNLRDRKPPVSRDLSIGFGNRPSPDANGRGGPSEQKKSRGTASLVLGVPIPDRVKGQPNPGKTKVTQERVEPRRETSKGVQAGSRTARSTPIGRVAEPRFAPWLRDAIRTYFLRLRQNPQGAR